MTRRTARGAFRSAGWVAACAGTVVMLVVCEIATSIVSVCRGAARPADWRNALAGAILLATVAVTAVWWAA